MIIWLTGNTGAGKTTLGQALVAGNDGVLLDGDELRISMSPDLGYSPADRRENNMRIAKFAKQCEDEGNVVVVAAICPYEDLRRDVQAITGCKFIHVLGGAPDTERTPYEAPENPVARIEGNLNWKTHNGIV